MEDSDKHPKAKDPEDWPTGWDWFFIAGPHYWIPLPIGLAISWFFDIPGDSELSRFVYILSFVVAVALVKIVLVYLLGRSLKRGMTVPSPDSSRNE